MDTSKGVRLVNHDGKLSLEEFDARVINLNINGLTCGPSNVSGVIPAGYYWAKLEADSPWMPMQYDPEWGWSMIGREEALCQKHPAFIELITPPTW